MKSTISSDLGDPDGSGLVLLQASRDGTTDVKVAQAAADVPIYISSRCFPVKISISQACKKSSMIFHVFPHLPGEGC